jgi:hypothetical protein
MIGVGVNIVIGGSRVDTPVGLVATAATGIGITSFTANWNAYTGAQYYLLDVSTSSSFSTFVYQDQVVVGTTSYVVIGLTENTTYYYRVRASTDAALLLDAYPSAAAAYSVRKLRSAYTGNAIRVRRSSDNTEQDIGFSGGNLDTTALTTFCGSGDGFVTTWYDQSGNAYNERQTTAANQPQIISSGSVLLENSKPAIRFIGANNNFFENSLSITFTYQTLFVLSRFLTRPSFAYIMQQSGNNKQVGDVAGNGYRLYNGANLFLGADPSLTNQDLIYGLYNGASSQIAVDGGTTTNGNTGTNSPSGLVIGTGGIPVSSSLNGNLQEIILYNSNQSSNRSAIETNINTYYGIY